MMQGLQGGSVFSVENESDTIVAAIQSSGISQYYECTLLCCDNPVCTCGTVHINFSPRGHHNQSHPIISSYQVDMDVVRRKLAYKDETKVSKENLAFAKLLLSSLDNADFQFLWRRYFAYKNEKTA